MKIVFLSDDFPPESFGGAGISTYELASGVQRAGHDVFVVTTCRKEKDAGEIRYDGLTIFKIQSEYNGRWRAYRSIYNGRVVRKIATILKKIKPDIVHANNIHFHISYGSLIPAKKYAKAVVFTARDTMAVTYGKLATNRYLKNLDPRVYWFDNFRQARFRFNPLRNLFIKKYLGYTDKIFAVSGSLADALKQNGIPDVEVMHTGIEISQWQSSPEQIKDFRARNNLLGKKVIMFGGRLSEGKGGRQTLFALARIVQKIPEAVLLVAGSVDWYGELMKKEADRLGISRHLVFCGWLQREDIGRAYASCDVVVVPSLYLDPFPRIVLEAMATGKAVVGTCFGGAKEAIEDGVTGYVINPFNTEEMAEKIVDLLADSNKREQFGSAGQARMKDFFRLEQKVETLISKYKEAHVAGD